MGQVVCTLECALKRTVKRRQQAEHKTRKVAIKSKTEWLTEAQDSFNRYVRIRDGLLPCISCGQPPGIGQRHASHYRSRAAAGQLRYHLKNTNASCSQCNHFKSGNVVEYRIGLVRKYGEEAVQALENDSRPASYSLEYLKRIKAIFNRKAKLYTRLREQGNT
jgi:5-methylcytosine-specific restriction endonuclease McrA